MSKRARVAAFKAGKSYGKKRRAPRGPSGMPAPIPRSAPPPVNARTGGLLGIELKFYDTSLNGAFTAPTDSAGAELDPATVLCLSAPPQGDGASERIGRHISAHSISLEGVVGCDPVAAAGSADSRICFIALVLDTQSNGTQLNSEDVYTNALANATTSVAPMRNMSERGRFRILAVKRVNLTVQGAYNGTNMTSHWPERYFRFYRKLNGMDINFKSGATAGISNVSDRSLHVIGFASDIAYAVPFLRYNSRLRYTG